MINPDKMTVEEITKAIDTAENAKDYFQEAFTAMQELIVQEIGLVMNDLVNKEYDQAYLRLRMLRDELVEDLIITKEKELSTTNQDNA